MAQMHLKIAAAAAAVEDYDRALREFAAAQPTLEYLAKADPDDSRVAYDLAAFYYAQALLYVDRIDDIATPGAETLRDARRAADLLDRALPILKHLVALQPNNRSWLANLAYAQVVLGTLEQIHLNDVEGARRSAAAYAVLMDGATLKEANVDVLELAVTAGLRIPASLRNTHATVGFAERLVAATDRQIPAHLLLLARALRADGRIDEGIAVAKEGLALVPPVPDDSHPPRLNRMLVRQAQSS